MLSFFTRLQRNRKGFTLIELMVVVVILGILAGAAIMTLGGDNPIKLKIARAESDIATMTSALEFYKLDVGKYPLTADIGDLWAATSSTPGWNGPYLKSKPENPFAAAGVAEKGYTYTSDDGLTYTITVPGAPSNSGLPTPPSP